MPAPADTAAPVPLRARLAARLGEASTWAGIGGVLLVALQLLPAALPALHAAFAQHGAAKTAALLVALLSFALAIARRENNATIANVASAVLAVLDTERACAVPAPRGRPVATSEPGG